MAENGWKEHQLFVLAGLEQLQDSVERLDAKSEIRVERLNTSLHTRCNSIDKRCTAIEVQIAGIQAVTKERMRKYGMQGGAALTGVAALLTAVVYLVRTFL